MKMTCAPVLLAMLFGGAALAQEPTAPSPAPSPALLPTPAPPAAKKPPTAISVPIVVSRTKAGKPVSRLPYTLTCIADGAGRPATLRMGVEVPIALGGGKGMQYRNVGINLDCSCDFMREDDRVRLKIALEQSSIAEVAPAAAKARAESPTDDVALEAGNPMFRTFNSTFNAILRDGQGAVSTAATDPVTGEEVTIEATAKVLK